MPLSGALTNPCSNKSFFPSQEKRPTASGEPVKAECGNTTFQQERAPVKSAPASKRTIYVRRPLSEMLADLDRRDLLHMAEALAKEHGAALDDLLARPTFGNAPARHALYRAVLGQLGSSQASVARLFGVDREAIRYAVSIEGRVAGVRRSAAAKLEKRIVAVRLENGIWWREGGAR